MDKSHDTPPSRRKKRRVNRTAVAVLALLLLATGWKLRSSGESGGSDDEPSNLELHQMQLEGGERYRAYLQRHPGDTERLHHLDEPETAHHREGRVGNLVRGHAHGGLGVHADQTDGKRHAVADADDSRSGNPRGGDLIATEAGTGDDDALDPSLDSSHYAFELIPPPTIQAGVVNAQHVDPTKDDHPRWMRDMWSEKTAAVAVSGSELDSKLESIPDELSAIVRPGQSLFVTFATWSVKDFVVNWLASAEKLNLRPIFVGALDEAIRDFCVARGVPTMLLKGNSVLNDRKKAFITAGDASFKKMGTVKTKFVQDLLEIGVAPILTDADVTWLRDPRAYFETGSYAVADALVSTDCIDVPADKADDNGCSHVNFNTGVLHFRPTEASKAFVEAWKTKVATSTIAWMRDQPAFNLLTHEGVGGHSLTPALRFKDASKKGTPGHRMVYYAANATLRLGVLPNWLFGSGHTYFVQQHHARHPEDGAPFSVHMTYQYGDTGAYAFGKRERMRQAGLWRADDAAWFGGSSHEAREGEDDGDGETPPRVEKFLSVADAGAQLTFPGPYEIGVDARAYVIAIRRHLAEDKLRRVTVRNALALADALGRTLVLPSARCFCDKIWNNLNACRAPGAETFALPYACPMDHIYDLPAWFKEGDANGEARRPFRAPGFLTDERLSEDLRDRGATVRVRVRRDAYEARAARAEDETARATAGDPRRALGGVGDARAWTAEEWNHAIEVREGFDVAELIETLTETDGAMDARVLEFDFLGGEETFCGFGDAARDAAFDADVAAALAGDQYYCFTELWREMGSPRGGGREPYEPQVVRRHCGHMENEFRAMGKVHPGTVEHIDAKNPTCSCEWGFGKPRGLAEIARDPKTCPRTR
jgi:hypothetical protein